MGSHSRNAERKNWHRQVLPGRLLGRTNAHEEKLLEEIWRLPGRRRCYEPARVRTRDRSFDLIKDDICDRSLANKRISALYPAQAELKEHKTWVVSIRGKDYWCPLSFPFHSQRNQKPAWVSYRRSKTQGQREGSIICFYLRVLTLM